MRTKKNMLRIGTILSILMFLLMPLLSSPVAAALNCTGISATTTAGPTGTPISITITGPTSLNFKDDGTGAINFKFSVSFTDAFITTRIPSSRHRSFLTVTIKTGTGTGGANGVVGWITLNDGQSYTNSYTVACTYTSTPTVFNVDLFTRVQEFPWGTAGDQSDNHHWEVTVDP